MRRIARWFLPAAVGLGLAATSAYAAAGGNGNGNGNGLTVAAANHQAQAQKKAAQTAKKTDKKAAHAQKKAAQAQKNAAHRQAVTAKKASARAHAATRSNGNQASAHSQSASHTQAPNNPTAALHTNAVQHTDNGHAGKITICHSTNSKKNPYVEITVSVNGLHGHGKHHEGRDIVPAPAGGCPTGSETGAQAENSKANEHSHSKGKITICHSTNSETNPFVEITISVNGLHGHAKHHEGGDIIPAPAGGCQTETATAARGALARMSTEKGAPRTWNVRGASRPWEESYNSSNGSYNGVGASPQASGVLGVSKTLKTSQRGVLGAASSAIVKQRLPFTGLPLWPVLVAGLGLAAAGLLLRWSTASRRS